MGKLRPNDWLIIEIDKSKTKKLWISIFCGGMYTFPTKKLNSRCWYRMPRMRTAKCQMPDLKFPKCHMLIFEMDLYHHTIYRFCPNYNIWWLQNVWLSSAKLNIRYCLRDLPLNWTWIFLHDSSHRWLKLSSWPSPSAIQSQLDPPLWSSIQHSSAQL